VGPITSKRKRAIDDAVAYAVGHRIRIDALAILNEGRASPSEISKTLDESVSMVGHHIKELFDSGCIESVGTEQVRGATEHFYRAVTLPYISDEEYRALSLETRRELVGLIIQAIMAEVLASFRARKLETDEDLWLTWQCLNLDEQGRREVADEQAESYARLLEIQTRNASRLAEAGRTGTTTVVAMMGFERSRPGRPPGGYVRRELGIDGTD
jgi:DNA-binding transcriptional ArsR family regulator